MQRQWKVRREVTECAEAQRRWDRAYQYLLQWGSTAVADPVAHKALESHSSVEVLDADRRVYAGVDSESGSGSDD